MQKLKEAISSRGKAIGTDVLLVDSFLNHQVDVQLMKEVGEAFADYYRAILLPLPTMPCVPTPTSLLRLLLRQWS